MKKNKNNTAKADTVDVATLAALQTQLHALIAQRAAKFRLDMPAADALPAVTPALLAEPLWYPLPGMYGGFKIELQASPQPQLLVSSWSRVCLGSSQRHVITVDGATLVEENEGGEEGMLIIFPPAQGAAPFPAAETRA